MEKEFRKITLTFGIIMAVLGALVIWRGVTKMIPVTGWVHGGLFTLGGLFFFLVGVALLALLTVLGGLVVYVMASRVPVVKRWLI